MSASLLRSPNGLRGLARLLVMATIFVLLLKAGSHAMAHSPPTLEAGTMEREPAGNTLISVQGYDVGGQINPNKPARLVSVGPGGDLQWAINRSEAIEPPPNSTVARLRYRNQSGANASSATGPDAGVTGSTDATRPAPRAGDGQSGTGTTEAGVNVSWFYDVDPLPNGDLLVVGTTERRTSVYRLNGSTRDIVWQETLPFAGTRDVTLTEDGDLLVANANATQGPGPSDDRLFVYDRETDVVEWEWLFRDHYDNDTAAGVTAADWTHVTDVDVIAPGLYMASPRNFDQVIVVDRSTNEIAMRLGADGNTSILDQQYNPSYLEDEQGRPTMLVADSGNDRVVEYTCDRGSTDHPLDGDLVPNCEWNLTWELGSEALEWPRDADRLPNGNTLVVDSLNHRVVELNATGGVVWSYRAPWLPYDVERPVHGREAGGPTMADLNVTGSYEVDRNTTAWVDSVKQRRLTERVGAAAVGFPGGWILESALEGFEQVAPWIRPVWLGPNAFFLVCLAGLLALLWALAELVVARDRVATVLRTGVDRYGPGGR